MKNITKNSKVTERFSALIRLLNFKKAVKVMGVVVAIIGFMAIIGAVDVFASDVSRIREFALLSMAGLTLLVGGCYVMASPNIQCKYECKNQETLPQTVNGLLGAMSYNKSYRSWMTIIDYVDSNDWTYVLCSRHGRPISTPVRTRMSISDYTWEL